MEDRLPRVDIHTDGSSIPNPGFGGWCAILQHEQTRKIIAGGDERSTSNRMELKAIEQGISHCIIPCEIHVWTDSDNAIGWLTGNKRNVKEINDLCTSIEIKINSGGHLVTFHKVNAHSGVELNDLADRLARVEAEKFKRGQYCLTSL
jgi:ribonuclease HI